jgi:hypothetical protein
MSGRVESDQIRRANQRGKSRRDLFKEVCLGARAKALPDPSHLREAEVGQAAGALTLADAADLAPQFIHEAIFRKQPAGFGIILHGGNSRVRFILIRHYRHLCSTAVLRCEWRSGRRAGIRKGNAGPSGPTLLVYLLDGEPGVKPPKNSDGSSGRRRIGAYLGRSRSKRYVNFPSG